VAVKLTMKKLSGHGVAVFPVASVYFFRKPETRVMALRLGCRTLLDSNSSTRETKEGAGGSLAKSRRTLSFEILDSSAQSVGNPAYVGESSPA
jgi:hypothetical protein